MKKKFALAQVFHYPSKSEELKDHLVLNFLHFKPPLGHCAAVAVLHAQFHSKWTANDVAPLYILTIRGSL